jgi:DNA-binding NtrC family response regulator
MPGVDGYGVLKALRERPETALVPFVFLSAKAERADVRLGMKLGADDYLTKPFTRAELLEAIEARMVRLLAVAAASAALSSPDESGKALPPRSAGDEPEVVLCDPAMKAIYRQASLAAATSISVLILGETGVGKEVLARAVHAASPRRMKPFLALNCASLSETLLESELFGYEKGAFTGALQARPGLFESAEGGTVFLDEVGDLPRPTQVKLLRVLEERKVMRVGARAPRSVDVRFLSATNRDLEADVEEGTFRSDLFFRLNGLSLTIPPLRERVGELVPLCRALTENACRREGRRTVPTIDDEARCLLEEHAWPGNVRELRNAIDRAVALCQGDTITIEHLPPNLGRRTPIPSSGRTSRFEAPASSPELRQKLQGEMAALEREEIARALERCGGNQTQAAEVLGISRRTLVTRLGAYGLPRPRKR